MLNRSKPSRQDIKFGLCRTRSIYHLFAGHFALYWRVWNDFGDGCCGHIDLSFVRSRLHQSGKPDGEHIAWHRDFVDCFGDWAVMVDCPSQAIWPS